MRNSWVIIEKPVEMERYVQDEFFMREVATDYTAAMFDRVIVQISAE